MTDSLDALSDAELDRLIAAARLELAELEKAWVLQDRQQRAEDFITDTDVFELLYGGAAGGGKSDWMLWHHYHLAQKYPGYAGLMLRRTFPELRRSLIERSWGRFDPKVAVYRASENTWRFNNGSKIEFGFCEADRDVYQYQSAEYDCVAWDELTQFPTDFPYRYLMSRCRTPLAKQSLGLRPHVIAGTNPGGVGGAWVKARFIDVGPPERVYRAETIIDGKPRVVPRVFIPAKRQDNKYLGDDYSLALANLPPATRRALEDGSWDTIEGQYFTEWRHEVHVVDPFEIPAYWRRIRGLDYGYTNPMCCLWAAIDEDDDLVVYRELYATGMTPRMQAERVNEMSIVGERGAAERIDYTVADPSVWIKTGAGPPIAEQYRDAGLLCRKANNARIDGWARLRDVLRIDPAIGSARIKVFSTCSNLVRTLPMLVHDDARPEDLDTDGEDHAADALRYLVMSRPLKTRRPVEEHGRNPDAEHWQRVRSRMKAKQSGTVGRPGSPVGTIT